MKVEKAGPATMVSRAKQITKDKDVKDGNPEGGAWRDLPQ